MRMLTIYILLSLLLSCSLSERKPSSLDKTSPIDIILDLDWTLIKQVDSSTVLKDPRKYVFYEGEVYRVKDGARELLESLAKRENIRISFFSGGGEFRNHSVLKQIKVLDKTAHEISYKILSKKDLTVVSNDESLSFTDRFKKDLRLVNEDLSKVVLIDDDKRFLISDEYLENLLWLGKTYSQYEEYSEIPSGRTVYDPKTYEQWFFDRNKLFMVRDILDESLDNEDFLNSMHRNKRAWNFTENRFSSNQAKEFIRKSSDFNCHKIMSNFMLLK